MVILASESPFFSFFSNIIFLDPDVRYDSRSFFTRNRLLFSVIRRRGKGRGGYMNIIKRVVYTIDKNVSDDIAKGPVDVFSFVIRAPRKKKKVSQEDDLVGTCT